MRGRYAYNPFAMKKILYRLILITSVAMVAASTVPTIVAAASPGSGKPLIITEMQAGTATSASQEFIELYNQSHQPIDLKAAGWHLEIATAEATSWAKAKNMSLEGVVAPGSYYLLARNFTVTGETKSYLQDYAAMRFTAALSAPSGHIRLVKTSNAISTEMDALEWSTLRDGRPVSPPISSLPSMTLNDELNQDESIKRKISEDGRFITDGEVYLVSRCPSATANTIVDPDFLAEQDPELPVPTEIDSTDQACLPVVGNPQQGGILQPPTEPPAILLPAETPLSKESVQSAAILANDGLKAPMITELLPNPAAPQTDAEDEFIELYNDNDGAFELSGYKLAVGLNGTRAYTFPNGTVLPAKSFVAFYSIDTKVSLSNSNGQARLRDPNGKDIAQTSPYGTAKDGQAWALANGTWQWTTRPTPHSTNAIIAPPATTKATTKKTAASAKTASAATTRAAGKDQQVAGAMQEEPQGTRVIHPWILAGAGVFALLYGAYEYRRDLANQLYKLRLYRTARRENRQSAQGR